MLTVNFNHQSDSLYLKSSLMNESSNCTAVIGISGAGKSTLLRVIAGLDIVPNSYVEFNGTIWQDKLTFIPTYLRKIAYISQDAYLFPHLSVIKNLEYAYSRAKIPRITPTQIIEDFGLEYLLERMPIKLSGGEKQKVALAQGLLSNPQLLLLDEAFSALDKKQRYHIIEYVKNTKIPMLFISHSAEEILQIADNIIEIKNGQINKIGTTNTMIQNLGIDGLLIDVQKVKISSDSNIIFASELGLFSIPVWQIKQKNIHRVFIPTNSLRLATTVEQAKNENILTAQIIKEIQINDNQSYTILNLQIQKYQLNLNISNDNYQKIKNSKNTNIHLIINYFAI